MDLTAKFKGIYTRFTETKGIKAIRQGLITLIPILLVGAISLTIKAFPIDAYQNFIASFADGIILALLDSVYNVTFGLLSIYMCISVAYHYDIERNGSGGVRLGCTIASLASFIIFMGVDSLGTDNLGPKGMFIAILATLSASSLFSFFFSRLRHKRIFAEGVDIHLNSAVQLILPITFTLLSIGLINEILLLISNGKNIHDLFQLLMEKMFSLAGDGFFTGLIFVLLSSILWFFGIHGSDVLEGVSQSIFAPNIDINMDLVAAGAEPTEILTKQFFDLFVLMGGCGSAMCLLLAILFFSKRRSNKSLAQMAALPMIFNINEIMIFGLPVIYNLAMLIPFMLVPVVCYLTSYFALAVGLVPLTVASVEWTTPVILGGFLGTGSVAGSILQIVNLAIGIMIYRPFVIRFDAERLENAKRDYEALVDVIKKSEQSHSHTTLTELPGALGAFAKAKILDIDSAIDEREIKIFYQPQYDLEGSIIGAEALIRFEDPNLGMIYPPLVIELAREGRLLEKLEKYVFDRVFSDADVILSSIDGDIKISVNISGDSLQSAEFEEFSLGIIDSFKYKDSICIEVTEQTAIEFNDELHQRIMRLKNAGYKLAIDDFSAGSTSLQYLQENSFDLVKLDGSIVQNCATNPRCKEIASSIVDLSHSLSFDVLAEYVSSLEVRDCMAEIGCNMYQGWFYSPAVEFDRLIEILEENKR